MARYINDFPTDKDLAKVEFIAKDFFNKEGFAEKDIKGEKVWKKGKGLITAPQFIKLECSDGKVHIEAWLKFALLPGVYLGELGLKGAFAFALKGVLKSRVNTLEGLLK